MTTRITKKDIPALTTKYAKAVREHDVKKAQRIDKLICTLQGIAWVPKFESTVSGEGDTDGEAS